MSEQQDPQNSSSDQANPSVATTTPPDTDEVRNELPTPEEPDAVVTVLPERDAVQVVTADSVDGSDNPTGLVEPEQTPVVYRSGDAEMVAKVVVGEDKAKPRRIQASTKG